MVGAGLDGAPEGVVEGCDGAEELAEPEGLPGALDGPDVLGPLPALDDGGLCGVLGALDGGPVGVVLGPDDGVEEPDDPGVPGVLGVPLGGPLGGPLGVLPDGPLGVLGEVLGVPVGVLLGVLLGVPGLPAPLSAIICPLGSKRTCACHRVLGSAARSMSIRIVVCAPGARIPDTALSSIHGASGVAVHETGPGPEFHSVTVTSPGMFERCVTLMFSCPAAVLGGGPGTLAVVADGSESIGPPSGGAVGRPGPAEPEPDEDDTGITAATTCAVTSSPPGSGPPPILPPATGIAGPVPRLSVGRG